MSRINLLSFLFLFSSLQLNANYKDLVIVYVVQQELHTGIVFKISEVDTSIWPEAADFKEFNFIDVGWGDFDFYQAPDNDPLLALKAIALPTTSVLRVDAFRIQPDAYYGNYQKLRFCMSRSRFDNLCKAISDSFDRDASGKAMVTQETFGLKFYQAKGKYHAMNTCNTWVANMFREAGFDNRINGIIIARQLFSSLSEFQCD
jgi:uncharacterized protein (TIGR02117 family)